MREGERPDGKTMAVNLHFYLTFNTMLTVIINTFLQDSSFFTARRRGKIASRITMAAFEENKPERVFGL